MSSKLSCMKLQYSYFGNALLSPAQVFNNSFGWILGEMGYFFSVPIPSALDLLMITPWLNLKEF